MIFYFYMFVVYLSRVAEGDSDDYNSLCPYDNQTSTFDCRNLQLFSIPHLRLPAPTKRLLLSRNEIEDANFIPSLHFANASVIQSVEILDLSYNHIHCLNFEKISIFTVLQELYIHHNQVQSIIPSTSVITLRHLSLGHNLLKEAVFSGYVFRHLQVLDLSNNLLGKLSNNSFPMSLKKLNLSENRLNMLNVHAFDNNTMLYVDLQENPWNCSKQLIIDYIFMVFDSSHVKTTCANGDNFCILCNRHLKRKQFGDALYKALTNVSTEEEQELIIKEVYLRVVILLETSLLLSLATMCTIKHFRRKFPKQMLHVELDNHHPQSSPLSSRRSLTTMVNQPLVPPRLRFSYMNDVNIYSEVLDLPPLPTPPSRPYIAANQIRLAESTRIRRSTAEDERKQIRKVRRTSSAPVMDLSSASQYLIPIIPPCEEKAQSDQPKRVHRLPSVKGDPGKHKDPILASVKDAHLAT